MLASQASPEVYPCVGVWPTTGPWCAIPGRWVDRQTQQCVGLWRLPQVSQGLPALLPIVDLSTNRLVDSSSMPRPPGSVVVIRHAADCHRKAGGSASQVMGTARPEALYLVMVMHSVSTWVA